MDIKYHKVKGAPEQMSPNKGGKISPKLIVLHYTATWGAEEAITTLTSRNSSASAHVVVDRDGTITQLVPFNTKAWHAGPSAYDGLDGLNSHSIGIEIVNPGFLREAREIGGADGVLDWAGNWFPMSDIGPHIKERHERVGSGEYIWPEYPERQLAQVEELCRVLLETYPSIYDIVTHEEIDKRGWKVDPGPAFPVRRFERLITKRDRDDMGLFDRIRRFAISLPKKLNVRGGPGTGFEVLETVGEGTTLRVLGSRKTPEGTWLKVEREGFGTAFVHADYVKRTM